MDAKKIDIFRTIVSLEIFHFICDTKELIHYSSGLLSEKLLKLLNPKELIQIQKSKNLQLPTQIVDQYGLNYLFMHFSSSALLVGPYLYETDVYETSLPIRQQLKNIHTLTANELRSYSFILQSLDDFSNEKVKPVKNILKAQDSNDVNYALLSESVNLDIEEIEARYRIERKLRNYIAQGDKEKIESLIFDQFLPNVFYDRLPNNPLRVDKNLSIISNTIGRLSAEKGGVPPYLLHTISEEYARKIEEARTTAALTKLRYKMIMKYCEAVKQSGTSNYSRVVSRSIHYILLHLHEQISLSELADHVETNKSYLARRFKKETGETITQFVRKKKINEAKNLLIHSSESVTNIALSMGYEDTAYFSTIFKQLVKVSPSEYRDKKRNDDIDGLPID